MERHGLVLRRQDPRDGRRKTVRLTEHGLDERRRLRPLVHRVEEQLTGSLPGQTRDALRSALRLLLAQRDLTP
jgi:DNA-binding MarR family transcriptional regulator